MAPVLCLVVPMMTVAACSTSTEPAEPEAPSDQDPSGAAEACPVTDPSPSDTYPRALRQQAGEWYGTDGLWVDLHNFALDMEPRQGEFRVKHAWWTGGASGNGSQESGAPEVRATKVNGAGEIRGGTGGSAHAEGFTWWPTELTFPSPGCWSVTGELGGQAVRFVVEVR